MDTISFVETKLELFGIVQVNLTTEASD